MKKAPKRPKMMPGMIFPGLASYADGTWNAKRDEEKALKLAGWNAATMLKTPAKTTPKIWN